MTKLSNANIEWFTELSLKGLTSTGWSSGTGTEEPFRCIAGPIPCGCITADSCPGFSAVETGMLATESVSSVLTTPFILTAVKLRSKIKSSRREHNSFNTRELQQRRQRRQRECQKSNRFRLAKQRLCTCITLFLAFLSSLYDYDVHVFLEDVNTRH